MAEQRPVPETLLDFLLYAPLGAAVTVMEELPRLADRGRERFGKQIEAAGMVGRFAVAGAMRRLKPPSTDRHAGSGTRADSGSVSAQAGPSTSERASSTRPRPAPSSTRPRPAAQPRAAASGPRSPSKPKSRPRETATARPGRADPVSDGELPIPAYDTLAASQVVERLASLSPAELESVRKHESATRRRRTVLHRIAQLNAERGGVAP
jgi:hypothetical protein